MSQLILSGGSTEKDLQVKKSEVNHLRLLLAWMRCEYMLDEHMQAGYAEGAKMLLDAGCITEDQARTHLARQADEIRRVPLYVRQGVKMLTRMIHEHEKCGDVVDGEVLKNRLAKPLG